MCEMIFNENCKVAIFKPPVGTDYRQIVMDYMMKMAEVGIFKTHLGYN